MKICWDNLERYSVYLTGKGNLRSESLGTLYEYPCCKGCGCPFLSANKSSAKFCSIGCQLFTKERNEKIRQKHIGKKHTAETKEKIRQSHIGINHTDKTKKKIAIAKSGKNNPMYGRKHTEETKRKMSENHYYFDMFGENNPFYGKKHTEEAKQKMRDNHRDVLGDKNNFYHKTHTSETKKKISKANRGKTISLKQRKASSEFMKKYNPMFNSVIVEKHRKAVTAKKYKVKMSKIVIDRWKSQEYRKKYFDIITSKGLRLTDEEIGERKAYFRRVRYYTIKNIRKFYFLINKYNYPIGIGKGFYHVDHVYSIFDGFRNSIDPKIIGSYINLQVIPSAINIKKGSKSWISKENLLERYNKNENMF